MNIGTSVPLPAYTIDPAFMAKKAEDLGFESIWYAEHAAVPVHSDSPFPATGGEIPWTYSHFTDPYIALARASGATSKIMLGTGITLVPERNPLLLAKEIASLDMLSRGRFIFGVGGGWNAEEMGNHGTNFKQRWRILRENILAMKAIWTEEESEFHGDHVNFDKMWAYPKPVQRPHPPILMGGDGPTTFDRVVEYCDGWMPIGGRGNSGSSLAEKIVLLKKQAEEAGRDPDSLNITSFGIRPDPDLIGRMSDAGVDRVIFTLPSQERAEVTPLIDVIT